MPTIGESASQLSNLLDHSEFGWHVGSLRIEIPKLTAQLDELQIQDRLTNLFSRIENVRQLGYRSQTNLEVDQTKAAELWMSIQPSVKEKIKSGVAIYRKKNSAIAADFDSLRKKRFASGEDMSDLKSLVKIFASLKAEVADFIGQVQRDTDPFPSLLRSIELRVSMVENALDLTSTASFRLKENEALLIALKAKDMNRKTDGVLTFTNQRIMYESLSTEKTERRILLDKPLDSVANIVKGKVGILAPEGLHVQFKTRSDPELKFATKSGGGEADLAVQYFDMITSGRTDEELKSGIDVDVRRRFKEVAIAHFPGVSFSSGRCKECGTAVSTPIKTYTIDGGTITGLFDCSSCHKPFVAVLARE